MTQQPQWRTTPLPKHWRRTRQRILVRDKNRCYLCSNPANEVDHINSASTGGTDTDTNLAAICTPCHRRKTSAEAIAARTKPPKERQPEQHPGATTTNTHEHEHEHETFQQNKTET